MKILRKSLLFLGAFALGLTGASLPFGNSKMPNPAVAEPSVGSPLANRQNPEIEPSERVFRALAALQDEQTLRGRAGLYEELSPLSGGELLAMIDRTEDLPPKYRNQLEIGILDRLFQVDPARANEWMKTHWDRPALWNTWMDHSPEIATKELLTRRVAFPIAKAMNKTTSKSPAEWTAFLLSLPASFQRNYMVANRVAQWSETDPVAALATIASIPPGKSHDILQRDALSHLAEKLPQAAMQQAETLLSEPAGGTVVASVAAAIAKTDPRAAITWIAGLPEEMQVDANLAVAKSWAKTDAAAALDWCAESGLDVTTGSVLQEAMFAHPAEATAWIDSQPDGPERDRLAERAVRERLNHFDMAPLPGPAQEAIFSLYAELPADAQVRTAASIGANFGQTGDLSNIGSWADQFGDSAARTAAITGAMRSLNYRPGASPDELLQTFTSAPDRDAALQGLALGSFGDSAIGRALQISDTTQRTDTLDCVIEQWSRFDLGACQSWLQSHAAELPPDVVGEWLATNIPHP